MTKTTIEERTSSEEDQWRQRIAEQGRSGLSVKRGLREYSFYSWRKRLQEPGLVRFALMERRLERQEPAPAGRSGVGAGDR